MEGIMKVLIIYAHPNPKSLNHAMLETLTKGLAEAGHTYEVVDLYDINFNPVLSAADFEVMQAGGRSDVKIQKEKVLNADALAFIYPIWFSAPPAILKGWIDRVFHLGFAYDVDIKIKRTVGLLKHEKVLVINTYGDAEAHDKITKMGETHQLVQDVGVFEFCGITNVQWLNFYKVVVTDDQTRKGYLKQVLDAAKNF